MIARLAPEEQCAAPDPLDGLPRLIVTQAQALELMRLNKSWDALPTVYALAALRGILDEAQFTAYMAAVTGKTKLLLAIE